ncbi:MAG: VOC family protein [Pseudomonadota bacterium]
MIVPNLMVSDMRAAIAFYRDLLGMTVTMMLMPDRSMQTDGDGQDAYFATLEWQGSQLMLQTRQSLAEELPGFDTPPSPAGTVYFRGFAPDAIADRVSAGQVVKGPVLQWYGMKELYLRDPDGHIICLGAPEGAPPG